MKDKTATLVITSREAVTLYSALTAYKRRAEDDALKLLAEGENKELAKLYNLVASQAESLLTQLAKTGIV